MNAAQILKDVIELDRENKELESKIADIENKIEQNHKRMIKYFSPYLLSVHEKWRPRREEKAMLVNLEDRFCCEVIIKEIDGNWVRAQEGEKSHVFHRFQLSPDLDEYEHAVFVVPQSSYDELKHLFDLKYLE